MHVVAPVTTGGSDEVEVGRPNTLIAITRSQLKKMMSKWVGLWRSMILSSLDQTAYPYSQYIRALNFSDLIALLDDDKFDGGLRKAFFAGAMSQFRIESDKVSGKNKGEVRLNSAAIQDAVGEMLTRKTPMLVELRAEPSSDPPLLSWVPRLSRLSSMTVWSGTALTTGVGAAIRNCCPDFKTLSCYGWHALEEQADSQFSEFLKELRPQTLQSLEVFSHPDIREHTLAAINLHGTSLVELKLYNLTSEGMVALPMLRDCTALTALLLAERGFTDLKKRQNDVFLDIIAWLKNCQRLRSITFQKIYSAPDILTPILMDNSIRLVDLEVTDYPASTAKDFHQALGHQDRTLRNLLLKGAGDDCDIDVLVDSLTKLVHLTTLRLQNVSDFFRNEHIKQVAQGLPQLESFWTSGYGITDAVWADLALLKNLRRLDINAWSAFTTDGILEYISKLTPGNWGLSISILMADPNSSLTEEEHTLIRDTLATKVEGRFDYLLARGKHLLLCSLTADTKS